MGLDAALERTPTGERPRFDAETGALVGSACSACGSSAWPGRAVCHRCGSASVYDRAFTGPALLESYTEVHVARPGLETPYVLGQVRLHDGPFVFGRIIGLHGPVELPCRVTARVDSDGRGAPVYWFEPE